MTTLAQLTLQTQWVFGLGLIFSFLAGVVFHRSHFCTMGAISDWVLMGDTTRAKQWALAVAVAVLGFGLMAGVQLINPLNTIYASPQLPWLSLFSGGLIFGVGMVLASGCASKSLIRLGAGNLKSLVVLLAMGIAALATLRGLPAVWRVNVLDSLVISAGPGPFLGQWWAAATGLSQSLSWAFAAFFVASALLFWVFKNRQTITPLYGASGVAVGLIVLALWWVSGVLAWVPEHPETLEGVFLASASGRMESLSLTAPLAYWLDAWMYFSDGSKRITLGMVTVIGILSGACCSALWEGSFRWEGFRQTSDLALHLIGGSLMGFGGVLAMGCTLGQGLSGLSTLSVGSVIAVFGIVAGAFSTLKWQLHRLEKTL